VSEPDHFAGGGIERPQESQGSNGVEAPAAEGDSRPRQLTAELVGPQGPACPARQRIEDRSVGGAVGDCQKDSAADDEWVGNRARELALSKAVVWRIQVGTHLVSVMTRVDLVCH
jgi:hypothetical protein